MTKRHIWQVLGQHQHLNTGAVSVTIPPVDNFQSNCPNIFWPPSCHELHGVKLSTYDVVSKEFYIVIDSFSVLPNIFFFGDRKDVFG